MAKLRIAGAEYPLMLTVGLIGDMAERGTAIQDIPKFFSAADHPLDEAIYNGCLFLHWLMAAGQEAAHVREGAAMLEIPAVEALQRMLTPGQVWALCDAAIFDSLRRTVEAEPEKNEITQ